MRATISSMAKESRTEPPTDHEGQRLKAYLTEQGVDLTDFAHRCKLKAPSGLYASYFKAERIGDRAWENAREALRSMGLDPTRIRSDPAAVMMRDRYTPPEDLEPLVERWSREQLVALKRVLLASQEARAFLLKYVNGRLAPPT